MSEQPDMTQVEMQIAEAETTAITLRDEALKLAQSQRYREAIGAATEGIERLAKILPLFDADAEGWHAVHRPEVHALLIVFYWLRLVNYAAQQVSSPTAVEDAEKARSLLEQAHGSTLYPDFDWLQARVEKVEELAGLQIAAEWEEADAASVKPITGGARRGCLAALLLAPFAGPIAALVKWICG